MSQAKKTKRTHTLKSSRDNTSAKTSRVVIMSKLKLIILTLLVAGIVSGVILAVFFKPLKIDSSQKVRSIVSKIPSLNSDKKAENYGKVTNDDDISIVDPYRVLIGLSEGREDIILVDIRSEKAYDVKHIKNTYNAPFLDEKGSYNSSFVKNIASIQKRAGGSKKLVLLPYSYYSTSGKEAILQLEKNSISAELLNIGWNELYNLPNMWVPEEKWNTIRFQDMIEHAE